MQQSVVKAGNVTMLRTLLLEILVLGQHGLAEIAAADSPDPYAHCNTNSSSHLLEQPRRGCLGQPSGCVASSDCKTLVTWAQDPDTKDVNFRILANGVSGSMGGYAAIGLNTNQVFQIFCALIEIGISHICTLNRWAHFVVILLLGMN